MPLRPLFLLIAAASLAAAQPLLHTPAEKVTASLGFRDWSPATLHGATILAGNQTGSGGLFAVDAATGKARWSFRPTFSTGTAGLSTHPAIAGELVIAPFAFAYPGALIAVSLATGKEVWRGPDPERNAGVAVDGNLAFILAKNGNFYALETASGRERWKISFATNLARCASEPIVRDGIVYLTAIGAAVANVAAKPPGYYLFALDAKTGQERWRYRAEAPYQRSGVCLTQPLVTADTIFATGDNYIYAVQRATGRDRWSPAEVRRTVEGRDRPVQVTSLVDGGSVVIGATATDLIAFSKDTGRIAWGLPGQYREASPSLAVSGNVLYFQTVAGAVGTLKALDLDTRNVLWSYTRNAAAPWAFGHVIPVSGGLWVDHYQALIKLE